MIEPLDLYSDELKSELHGMRELGYVQKRLFMEIQKKFNEIIILLNKIKKEEVKL